MDKSKIISIFNQDLYNLYKSIKYQKIIQISIICWIILFWTSTIMLILKTFTKDSFLVLALLALTSSAFFTYAYSKEEEYSQKLNCITYNKKTVLQYKDYYIVNNWNVTKTEYNSYLFCFYNYYFMQISEETYNRLKDVQKEKGHNIIIYGYYEDMLSNYQETLKTYVI